MNALVRSAMIATALFVVSPQPSQAAPPAEKLNWGVDYYHATCKPAMLTRHYAELWPMMTRQERQAVNTAQQEHYYREQDVYRSWVLAFQKVLVVPERVRSRGLLYANFVQEDMGIEWAVREANETLAACVAHMAKQLERPQ